MMRILQISNLREIKQIMQGMKVDTYGVGIMLPKAIHYLIRMDSISNITANILKQEMLSLGGDAAVARDALTGRTKKTDCLLMGSLSQLNRLGQKLNRQPFGLDKLSKDLSCILKNYQKDNFILDLGRYKLNLSSRTHLMGIVNLTPDSFSQDGLYQRPVEKIVEFAQKLAADGADIIDIGGESSRPGAKPVSVKEELQRTIPVIKALSKRVNAPISIDTYKPEVAMRALDCGACIINDITGLRDPKMIEVAKLYRAAVVVMHMKGKPRTMQKNHRYNSLLGEIIEYLSKAINRAKASGIDTEKIIIDPGLGFGKSMEHNLEILKRLKDFKVLGRPILVGPSRKSFIGRLLNTGPKERIFGTVSSACIAAEFGAKIIRAHDVKELKQALNVCDAILGCGN